MSHKLICYGRSSYGKMKCKSSQIRKIFTECKTKSSLKEMWNRLKKIPSHWSLTRELLRTVAEQICVLAKSMHQTAEQELKWQWSDCASQFPISTELWNSQVRAMAVRCWFKNNKIIKLHSSVTEKRSGCNVWTRPCRNLSISKTETNCRLTYWNYAGLFHAKCYFVQYKENMYWRCTVLDQHLTALLIVDQDKIFSGGRLTSWSK